MKEIIKRKQSKIIPKEGIDFQFEGPHGWTNFQRRENDNILEDIVESEVMLFGKKIKVKMREVKDKKTGRISRRLG